MADTHDTIDGLLAEFRGYSAGMPPSYHVTMSWHDFRVMLDRLDAAHKREVATTKESLAVGNSGDCAKLREALETALRTIRGVINSTISPRSNTVFDCRDKLAYALAAPPRNCDRPECATLDMATKTWIQEEFGPLCNNSKATIADIRTFDVWIYAPATEKEGGAK